MAVARRRGNEGMVDFERRGTATRGKIAQNTDTDTAKGKAGSEWDLCKQPVSDCVEDQQHQKQDLKKSEAGKGDQLELSEATRTFLLPVKGDEK